MKLKIIASIFALTAFASLAQPTLPTTNSFIVPIANPYSGSWIYYTTNAASGLSFLNGASLTDLTNYIGSAGSNGTNYANQVGLNTTNYANTTALAVGDNATNLTLQIGANDTNYANQVGLNTTNYANAIGLGATNLALQIGANGTNFALTIGGNATNYVNTAALAAGPGGNTDAQSLTNVQNITWGTTTNKPTGTLPVATVYYYFTNGYPMFGIISTNN